MKKLEFEVDEEQKIGKYSDVARIAHSLHDFTIDFGQVIPEEGKVKILARIKMSPTHTKAFLASLSQNLKRYESKFGEITLPKAPEVKGKDLTYIG